MKKLKCSALALATNGLALVVGGLCVTGILKSIWFSIKYAHLRRWYVVLHHFGEAAKILGIFGLAFLLFIAYVVLATYMNECEKELQVEATNVEEVDNADINEHIGDEVKEFMSSNEE